MGNWGEGRTFMGEYSRVWVLVGNVGDMSATHDIVGECRRHGVSLPTTCQQGARVTSAHHFILSTLPRIYVYVVP